MVSWVQGDVSSVAAMQAVRKSGNLQAMTHHNHTPRVSPVNLTDLIKETMNKEINDYINHVNSASNLIQGLIQSKGQLMRGAAGTLGQGIGSIRSVVAGIKEEAKKAVQDKVGMRCLVPDSILPIHSTAKQRVSCCLAGTCSCTCTCTNASATMLTSVSSCIEASTLTGHCCSCYPQVENLSGLASQFTSLSSSMLGDMGSTASLLTDAASSKAKAFKDIYTTKEGLVKAHIDATVQKKVDALNSLLGK